MSKYELPSGTASIDAVVGFNTEKDYTAPMSKRDISTALRESLYCNLEQQERIAELEAALLEVIYHFESGNGDHSDLNDGMIPKLKELAIKGDNNETT